ncbi:MAG: galactokinase [Bacteroidales bacterium]
MMKKEELIKIFKEKYGENSKEIQVFFSPGRVNLIGEHTDYNGGYVFPCALNFGTYLVARQNDDNMIKFTTMNFDFETSIPVGGITKKVNDEWVNYPLGVIDQYLKEGKSLTGFDFLYSGDIPNGAGLSSSASIEMVTAYTIRTIMGFEEDMISLVKLSQRAENQFVGVNCGIMDQFSVGMGKENKAIFLNCDTLEYELVPIVLKNHKIVISNTNKRRGLADSKYNERRSECDKAVEYLNQKTKISLLGEISMEQFNKISDVIPDETVKRRARHVISENKRVLDAVDALKNNDLKKFGDLMNASHDSLRDDYEVTGKELDTLVEEARKIKGTVGSRMTGAGFGGCTVSIVENAAIDNFINEVGKNYKKRTGLEADFYIGEVGDGTRKI